MNELSSDVSQNYKGIKSSIHKNPESSRVLSKPDEFGKNKNEHSIILRIKPPKHPEKPQLFHNTNSLTTASSSVRQYST